MMLEAMLAIQLEIKEDIMNSNKLIPLAILIVVLVFLLSSALFTVRQTQQALVLQFGNPVSVKQQPGLHFKIPFIQNISYYDTRILNLDPPEFEVLLADKKRINVDAHARYRITDPLEFHKRIRTESRLNDRLGKTINAAMRRVIARIPLNVLLSEERVAVMSQIQSEVNTQAKTFGIEIIDVRIGRTDLPPQTSQAVFQRMRTEREREARELRAEGAETAQKIRASADKEKTVIVAEARRQSDILKGEGEAERNRILGTAFSKDPEFFEFNKSLEQYGNALSGQDTTFILSPDSDFFRYFGTSTLSE